MDKDMFVYYDEFHDELLLLDFRMHRYFQLFLKSSVYIGEL
jgi:hypothetical protein